MDEGRKDDRRRDGRQDGKERSKEGRNGGNQATMTIVNAICCAATTNVLVSLTAKIQRQADMRLFLAIIP